MDILSQVCKIELFDGQTIGNETLEDDFLTDLMNMSTNNMKNHWCIFSSTYLSSCKRIFKDVITGDGRCFEFNNFADEDPNHKKS